MLLDSLIIGAGISGLSAAWTLQKEQKQFLVAEAQGRVGGNITTNQRDGFLWEEGPNSFLPVPQVLKLLVEVGLKDDLVLADHRLPRYVYWGGRLNPVPMTPIAALTTSLLSPLGKLRAGLGALGFVPPALGAKLSQQGGEETIYQFVSRHLGSEVAERLISPFVSGVYAGDVNALSMGAAFRKVARLEQLGGSLLAGSFVALKQRPEQVKPDPSLPQVKRGQLGSFREGLKMLPEAIASRIGDSLRLNWQLTTIAPKEGNTYLVSFDTPEGPQQIHTRTLILTTPAHITAKLLKPLAPALSQVLDEIPYPPVACVVLAYPQGAFNHSLQGFGNLNPRKQGIRTLGSIWSSTLFPGRNPEGWKIITNFIGGATDPEIATLTEAEIAQQVDQDLSKVLVKKDSVPKVLAVHLWKQAIPQYTLGHLQRLEQIDAGLKSFPGLYLTANYSDGVALGDCVRRGLETAAKVAIENF